MPRKSQSKTAKTAKAAAKPKAAETKPVDPTEAEAEAEAAKTNADFEAAMSNGGSNPEPASEEAKADALERQADRPGGAKVVSGLNETDAAREEAREQSEERREAVGNEANGGFQPSAEFAENEPENPVDREEIDADVPRPAVYSSADMGSGSPVDPNRTATMKKIASQQTAHRAPSATERKLAQQGLIPPYRD